MYFLCCDLTRVYIPRSQQFVEAGSKASTGTLRVVGGDETGNLKSEAVKFGRESPGLAPEKDCSGKDQ
jgi:hypothetical protein